MKPISLADLMNQVNSVTGFLSESSMKISEQLSAGAALAGKDRELLQQAAVDTEMVAATKNAAELRTQEAKLRIGNDFGTNRNAQNEVYSALSAIERKAWEDQQAAKAVIDRKRSVGLMDNPIEYIMNQLTVNQDIQRHNSANETRQAVLQRIAQLNDATRESSIVQQQFTQTMTAEAADAAVRIAALPMQRSILEADAKAIQYNVQALREARDTPIKALEMTFQLRSAQNADEGLAISRRSAARQDMLAQLSIEREKRLAAKEIKDERTREENDATLVGYINTGRALRGFAPLSDLRGKEVLQIIRTFGKDNPTSQQFMFDLNKGMEELGLPGGAKLAESPAEMIALQQAGVKVNATPSQQVVLTRMNDALAIVKSQNATKPLDPKDTAGAKARLEGAIKQVIESDQQNIKLGDASNPYSFAPLAALAQAVPSIQANPAFAKSLKARVDSGEDLTDPKKIFTALAEDMRKGKITYQEAISASEIFMRGVEINNKEKAFTRFGLPEATSFNVIIDKLPYVPGGTEQVNFLRPDSLGRALLASAVQQRPFSFMDIPAAGPTPGFNDTRPLTTMQRPQPQN
jgi:hypothetical protein